MERGFGERSANLVIGVALVAATVLIVMIALDTTPIADDYGDLAHIQQAGILQYLHNYWLGLTDRYSDALFMALLIKLFGGAALQIATPLLIGCLFCFAAFAAHSIGGPGHGKWEATVVGGVAAIAIAGAAPSIFDTLGWFNAVSIYFAGVVGAAASVAWMTWLAINRPVPKAGHIAASFVVGLVAAGFTELIGIAIALGSVLAIANVRSTRAPGTARRALSGAYAAVAAGAAAGVAVIFLGPGSRSRVHFQKGGFDLSRILDAFHANLVWLNTFRWDALACAAAGVLVFKLRRASVGPRTARWLFVWCVFLILVPMLVVDASTAYSGPILAAPRTAYIALAGIGAGLAVLAYILSAAVFRDHPRFTHTLGPSAAVGFALAVLGLGTVAAPVIKAEQLRRVAVQARGASIERQLRLHRRSISVTPAPLIIVDTSAFDLTFHHSGQYVYVLAGLHQYYGIPTSTTLRVIPRQPRSYCLPGVVVPWAGVESCEQLRAQEHRPTGAG